MTPDQRYEKCRKILLNIIGLLLLFARCIGSKHAMLPTRVSAFVHLQLCKIEASVGFMIIYARHKGWRRDTLNDDETFIALARRYRINGNFDHCSKLRCGQQISLHEAKLRLKAVYRTLKSLRCRIAVCREQREAWSPMPLGSLTTLCGRLTAGRAHYGRMKVLAPP